MPKDSIVYLNHIFDECQFIISVIREDLTEEVFMQDETLKRAVIRSLEIIGEASKKISEKDKANWNLVQWRNMAGMRDRLIHHYMGVNYTIVWDVVKHKIPDLSTQIQQVLNAGDH